MSIFDARFEIADSSPKEFTHAFLPDDLLSKMARHTNNYARKRLPAEKVIDVSPHHVAHFFAIMFYMGIVYVPHSTRVLRMAATVRASTFLRDGP